MVRVILCWVQFFDDHNMEILTEINSDCSFMQTIIKLPQERVNFLSVGIDINIIDKLENYLDFVKDIQILFHSIPHIKNFIENCVLSNQVNYVKTFSVDTEDISENREFICFGEYHRNLKGQHNLFFRIDQNWDSFDFPTVDNFQNLKKYFSFLSGTTIDTILPSIILEQKYLNDISDIILNHNIELTEFEKLYLFSIDYFGKSYFFNNKEDVFYLKPYSKTIEKSEFDFKHWLDNELYNILKPKPLDN